MSADFFQFLRNNRTISGIKKLGFIPVDDIPRFSSELAAVGRQQIAIPAPSWIKAVDATISVKAMVKAASKVFSSTITFYTSDSPPEMPVAFVAVDPAGETWLISGPEPHFGTMESEASTSSPSGDPVSVKCSVSIPNLPLNVTISA